MQTIGLLFILGLVVIIWLESLKVREFVIARCQLVCKEAKLQLLDQTVALVALSVRRSVDGALKIHREYKFEVSADGVTRYAGFVNLMGKQILSIRFEGPDGENIFHQSKPPPLH